MKQKFLANDLALDKSLIITEVTTRWSELLTVNKECENLDQFFSLLSTIMKLSGALRTKLVIGYCAHIKKFSPWPKGLLAAGYFLKPNTN